MKLNELFNNVPAIEISGLAIDSRILPPGLQSQTAQSGELYFFQNGRSCGTGRLQALSFVQAGTCSRFLYY